MRKSRRLRQVEGKYDPLKRYALKEALAFLKECPPVKFDQSVEVAIKTGVDMKRSEQQVRSTVSLPHGTGKKTIVVVIAKGDKVKEAENAGADFAGFEEYLEKIKNGWTDFDVLIATPDMMRELGKLGKILGPRGLMPTPKAGTVTMDIASAVKELKAGRIEFKTDKQGDISNAVGKLSFPVEKLEENILTFMHAVSRAKPPTAKGIYIRSVALSSTMGPGLKIDIGTLALA